MSSQDLIRAADNGAGFPQLPLIIAREGQTASRRFLEFFTANIRNPNTRLSYIRAISPFLAWCDERGLELRQIEPMAIAAYIERLTQERAPQTVKQHLAAIRMLFGWLVTGQIVPVNPAASVRGPRYSIRKGKTPVLSAQETRKLLDSIDTSHVVGLRDRALIGTMVYSFARVSAIALPDNSKWLPNIGNPHTCEFKILLAHLNCRAKQSAIVNMKIRDYYPNGKRYWIRLHEKGGKFHAVPAHHTAEQYLDEYIEAAGIAEDKSKPLFALRGAGAAN